MNTLVLKKGTALFVFAMLLFFVACSNLHKVRSSDLHKKDLLQENAARAEESLLQIAESSGMVLKNDSSNYWLWFQSANPFQFHPDSGLLATNGELWLGGNTRETRLEQNNRFVTTGEWKDSSASEKMSAKEKTVVKELEKHRKGRSGWWWVFGGLLVVGGIGYVLRIIR